MSGIALARFSRRRKLLAVGMFAPFVALAAVVVGTATFPGGFDHATQFLSELGGAKARFPQVFNYGVMASGLLAVAAGIGFGLAIAGLGGSRVAAAMTALAFVLGGLGLFFASLYPWPDPRHRAVNLGLGIQLAPLFLLWGLARVEGLSRLRWFLAVVAVLMAILTVITKHLVFKGMVNDANVGWWERAYALVLVGWTGIAAFALERRLFAQAAKAG